MQRANHYICCSSGLPQLSGMPSLISGDWQFLPFFFFYSYNVWDFFVPLCFTSSPPLPPPPLFFLEDSSVKEVSCHRLGMWVLTVPDRRALWCLSKAEFSPDPRFRCFFPSTQRPARWICFVLLIWKVGGACSFSWSDGQLNCSPVSVVVDAFTREFLCVFRKRLRAVMSERLSRNLRGYPPLPMEISTRIIRLCSEAQPLFLCHGIRIVP